MLVSQKAMWENAHGVNYRSSGIFYAIHSPTLTTHVTLLNYWKIRNSTKVSLCITLRDTSGVIVNRDHYELTDNSSTVISVKDYLLNSSDDHFEGSIEVEAYSCVDLRVPFGAFMVFYDTPINITCVHTYARIYSPHEVQEDRMVSPGHESNWRIDLSKDISNFFILHAGPNGQESQKICLTLTSPSKHRKVYEKLIPAIKSYGTLKVPVDSVIVTDFCDFSNATECNCSVDFELDGVFPRLLIGRLNIRNSAFQVTHSNFNYKKHSTEFCDSSLNGSLPFPSYENIESYISIYPDFPVDQVVTSFEAIEERKIIASQSFDQIEVEADCFTKLKVPEKSNKIHFSPAKNSSLPRRIPFGVCFENKHSGLASECSLNIMHKHRPPKRMWWGPLRSSSKYKSSIYFGAMEEIYGKPPTGLEVKLSFYDSQSSEKSFYSSTLSCGKDFFTHHDFKLPHDLISKARSDFFWYTFYSDYGGFFVYTLYTTISSDDVCLEHAF